MTMVCSVSDSYIEVYMYDVGDKWPVSATYHKCENSAVVTSLLRSCWQVLAGTGCFDLFCLLQCQEQEMRVDEGLYPHQFNPNMSLVGVHHSKNIFHNNMCFSNVISCNLCATLFQLLFNILFILSTWIHQVQVLSTFAFLRRKKQFM